MQHKLFTSESVTEGHPDKVADIISDTILDKVLDQDRDGRVACETFLSGDLVVIGGEITSTADVDYEAVARDAIRSIGYNRDGLGLNADTVRIIVQLQQQSPEIAGGVFDSYEHRTGTAEDPYALQGAGDQGIVFGYANGDNSDLFPVAGKLAHLLSSNLTSYRRALTEDVIRPDGKTQVTIKYEDGIPVGIDTVLISTQHSDAVEVPELEKLLVNNVINPTLEQYDALRLTKTPLLTVDRVLVNPAGAWHVGGPESDAGLTGRKIIVDSYCGYAKHGGGNYNGKDPSKTDRSAAYATRWVAKNIVATGLADAVEVQVSYAIGSARPVSINIEASGTERVPLWTLERAVNSVFDLRPAAIIDHLALKHIPYSLTATNGHFGRNPSNAFTWEHEDKVEALLASVQEGAVAL